jgi:hypothetical protein
MSCPSRSFSNQAEFSSYYASRPGQESEQTRRMGICEDFSLLRLRLCAMDSSTIRIGAARCRRSESELVARKACV